MLDTLRVVPFCFHLKMISKFSAEEMLKISLEISCGSSGHLSTVCRNMTAFSVKSNDVLTAKCDQVFETSVLAVLWY